METIITNKGTFILVEVHRFGIIFYENMGYLIYKEPAYENEGKSDYKQAAIKLPDGNYKFLAVMKSAVLDRHEASQNLTEEIAADIVDDNGMGCYDNYRLKKDEKYTCRTAMDSFSCLILMSKHSLKADANYAVLKLAE